jgi:predicted ATPase
LALELAAARLAHLTVAELVGGLGDSLSLLRRAGRGRLHRQLTLAATLDWSHGLLTVDEQRVFSRMSVFAGGFDSSAAAAVGEIPDRDVTAVLSRLVDKSLLHADTSRATTRYRLLEVVRQYAQARAGDAAELATSRERHLRWYAQAVMAKDPDRGDAQAGEPSGWFDVEKDNLRAAFSTAIATNPPVALTLATATWRFWTARGLIDEGAGWLDRALGACVD